MKNKVIKTILLGISAAAIFSTPMLVHAEEIDNNEDDKNKKEVNEYSSTSTEASTEDEYDLAISQSNTVISETATDIQKITEDNTTTITWNDTDGTHERVITSTTEDLEDTSATEEITPESTETTEYNPAILDHTESDGTEVYKTGETVTTSAIEQTTTNENITKTTTVKETVTTTATTTEIDSGIYKDNQDLAEIKGSLGDYGIISNEVNINNDLESNFNAGNVNSSTADIGTNDNYVYKFDETSTTNGKLVTVENVNTDNVSQIKLKNNSSIEFEIDDTTTSTEGKASTYYDVITPDGTIEVTNVTNIEIKDSSYNDVSKTIDNITILANKLRIEDDSIGTSISDRDSYHKDINITAVEKTGETEYDIVYTTLSTEDRYNIDWSKVDYSKVNWNRYNLEGASYFYEMGWATKDSSVIDNFENCGGCHISMNDNQILVINVDTENAADTIEMNKFTIKMNDGNEVGSDVFNQTEGKYSQQIVFNFGDYSGNIHIVSSIMGTVIAPKATVLVDATSTGQIVCNKFTNRSGEWHYSGNSASSKATTKKIVTKENEYSFYWKSKDTIITTGGDQAIEYTYNKKSIIPVPVVPPTEETEEEVVIENNDNVIIIPEVINIINNNNENASAEVSVTTQSPTPSEVLGITRVEEINTPEEENGVLGARRTKEAAVLGARRNAETSDDSGMSLLLMELAVGILGIGSWLVLRKSAYEK